MGQATVTTTITSTTNIVVPQWQRVVMPPMHPHPRPMPLPTVEITHNENRSLRGFLVLVA